MGLRAGAKARRKESVRSPHEDGPQGPGKAPAKGSSEGSTKGSTKGLAPRRHAATLLLRVLRDRALLDDLLSEPGPAATLDERDRAFARAIVTASLRHLGTLRHGLARFLHKDLPPGARFLEATLVTGAAQILFLDSPDHAAVDAAVALAKGHPASGPFAGVVNAVLRKVAAAKDELLAEAGGRRDTPDWLFARWSAAYGEEAAIAIAAAHGREPALDITVKGDPQPWAARLDALVLPTGSLRLRGHAPVAGLDGYGEGAWWVQDAAAALPARLLRPAPGLRILDLCAAPGGKTAQLAAAGAKVTALDRSAHRLARLKENMARLGLDVEAVAADALDVAPDTPFDAVLLDAPCTATGTIRRHPDVAWIKRSEDIAALAAAQARLLARAATLVRPGGRLVYCTCSLEPEEGERQIAAFLAANPAFAREPVAAGEIGGLAAAITPDGDLRTLPSMLPHAEPRLCGLDGFFAARLVRAV